MRKTDIIEIGKHMAQEIFELCVGGSITLEDGLQVLGFKEDEDHNWYIMTFMHSKIEEYRCEIIYNLSTCKIESKLFKLTSL